MTANIILSVKGEIILLKTMRSSIRGCL